MTDLGTSALDPLLQLVLGCRMAFATRLDADTLARATRMILDVEPVLGCWLRESALRGEWVRCDGLDERQSLQVVETDDPDGQGTAFHSKPFDPRGPRVEVVLLRTPEGDEVCVKLDHVAGDGWSMKEVACLLAETYSRLVADPTWTPEPDLTPRPTTADVWKALSPDQREAAKHAPGLPKFEWKTSPEPGRGDGLGLRSLSLPPQRFGALRDHGKARGATVHEVLVASLLRATAALFPPPSEAVLPVSMSANLRLLVDQPSLRRISNISSTNFVGIGYEDGEVFDQTLQRVVEAVRSWKEALWGVRALRKMSLPPFLMRTMFAGMGRRLVQDGVFVPTIMNIGVLDEGRLTFADAAPTAAHILGPIPKLGGIASTVSTYAGTLTVSLGANAHDVDPTLLEKTLDVMDQELLAAT